MRKISLKPALCAVFFSLTALVLSVCILEPVTVNEYVENEIVTGIIGRDAGKVNIITEADWADNFSDTGLTAGNGRISGLKNDKYYIIEEYDMEDWDEHHFLENVQFVKSDGTRSSRLQTIGKVAGGTITGLTNGRWYLVRSAELLTGEVTYFDLAAAPLPGDTGESKTIKDGEITLSAPEKSYYLKFSPAITNISSYTLVKIPVSPPANSTSAVNVPTSSGSIKLEGKNTETDYIFHKKDGKTIDLSDLSDGKHLTVDAFYILKVSIEDALPPPELVITIVPYVHPTDQTFTFAPASEERTQTQALAPGGLNISVTVTIPSGFTANGWYYGGNNVSTTDTLNTATASIDFTVIGTYEFTFVMTKDGVPYNGAFTIKIKE